MNTLGKVYTLHEGAEKLRQRPRTVAKIARRHGFCSIFGRDISFSEEDLVAIWQITRASPNEPPVGTRSPLKREGDAFEALVKLVKERKARSKQPC